MPTHPRSGTLEKAPKAYLDDPIASFRDEEHLVITVLIYHRKRVLGVVEESFSTDINFCNLWLPTNLFDRSVEHSIRDLGKELVRQWTGCDCFIYPEPFVELVSAYPLDAATNPPKPTILLEARIDKLRDGLWPDARLVGIVQDFGFGFAWIDKWTAAKMARANATVKVREAFEFRDAKAASDDPLWAE